MYNHSKQGFSKTKFQRKSSTSRGASSNFSSQSRSIPVSSEQSRSEPKFENRTESSSPSRSYSSSSSSRPGSYSKPQYSRYSGSSSSQRPYRSSGFQGRGRFQSRSRSGAAISSHDVSRFIKKASVAANEIPQHITHSFTDFNFSKELNDNIIQKKYTIPTPVQDQSIPVIVDGKDIIGLANTGTGKTGAFLLPLIEKVKNDRTQKVLIMAPTRELALQIEAEFKEFAQGMRIYSAFCVGGMSIYNQIYSLRRNPQFVIGTPGRLKDLSDRRVINFGTFNNVVVDEVDHMLDMGFIEPIRDILNQLAPVRQSLFFSATMPLRIRELVGQFLKNPVTIEIKSAPTTNNIEQDIIRVKERSQKFAELQKLLERPELEKVLIFSETKRDVERLTNDLLKIGFKAESLHGDKRQHQRQKALTSFRDNQVTILVATDVAARGLDIKDITHVINYTIPQTHDDYTHRIGRTGRGGKGGHAFTFV